MKITFPQRENPLLSSLEKGQMAELAGVIYLGAQNGIVCISEDEVAVIQRGDPGAKCRVELWPPGSRVTLEVT